MGKQVPLVMYRRGVRTQLGMASVEDDGSISAQVERELWPMVKNLFLPGVGEFFIAPAQKPDPAKLKAQDFDAFKP